MTGPAGLVEGLSPRVRGNLFRCKIDYPPPGSIPACAGEPLTMEALWVAIRVYPRVCGGTLETVPKIVHGMGLSPRVRGNLSCTFPVS